MLKSIEGEAHLESEGIFELKNIALGVSWVRLVLYFAGFVGTQLLQLLQGDFLSISVWQPINLIIFSAMMLQILFIEIIAISKWRAIAIEWTLIADCVLLALFMSVLGVYHSVFLFLLLINISVAGFSLGMHSGLKIGIFGLACMNLVWATQPQFNPDFLKSTWMVSHVSVGVVVFLAGLLGEQIQIVKKDIVVKSQEIISLTNINELIVDNIPSGIIVFNSDMIISRANKGAARIFSSLSLEGSNLSEIFIELQMEAQKFIQDKNRPGTLRLELNYYNYKKEKMIIEAILSTVNLRSENQGSFLCLLQNLTEIKNLEFAMQQKEKLAAVGQLAAGIAHEIRNPLASISGSVQLLQANLQTQTDEDKKLLNIVIREIDRLNKLITEFLDFVRPDVRVEDPININQLAKEVLEIVKMHPQLSKKVEQHSELRAQNLIYGHYDKLKQAILNIIINSYQAVTDTLRPEVFIQTYDSEEKVVLVIRDNGIGISKDNIKRIFEPFHTTKSNGTGLGLAITHKILETHHAEVYVESEVGQGTKFSIVFPVGTTPLGDNMFMKKQA